MRKDEFPLIDTYTDRKVSEILNKVKEEVDNINLNEVATKYEDRFYGFQREVIKIIDKYKESEK